MNQAARSFSSIIFAIVVLGGLAAWIFLGTRPGGGERPGVAVVIPKVDVEFLDVDLADRTEGLRPFGTLPVTVDQTERYRQNPFAGF